MWWSPLVTILQRSPPTKCPLPAGGRGGAQAGAGAAEMCCGHLLLGHGELGWCWGETPSAPVHRETLCRRRGAWGYLCALPQGAQAVRSSSSAALLPSPDNHRVSSGEPWH